MNKQRTMSRFSVIVPLRGRYLGSYVVAGLPAQFCFGEKIEEKSKSLAPPSPAAHDPQETFSGGTTWNGGTFDGEAGDG
jgi:hypothetical protein